MIGLAQLCARQSRDPEQKRKVCAVGHHLGAYNIQQYTCSYTYTLCVGTRV